jgi:hypothetical protein
VRHATSAGDQRVNTRRMTMFRALSALTLALSFALAGCGSDPEKAIEEWTDNACGCKDQTCAEKQKEAFDVYRKKYKDEIEKMDEGDQKDLENIYRKGRECLKKFDVNAG